MLLEAAAVQTPTLGARTGLLVTKPPVVEIKALMVWLNPPMSSVPGAIKSAEPPTLTPVLLPMIVTLDLPAPLGSALAMPSWRVPALMVVAPE